MTKDGRKITCVEFFDETPADNMCVALTNAVDEIVLLGSSTKTMERAVENYSKVISAHDIVVNFKTKAVPRNDIGKLVDALTEIATASDICLFDLTGGEDLALVAAGIVYERLKGTKEIQMHRFDIAGGTREKIVVNCDDNPETYFDNDNPPEIDVIDNIELSGGEVVENENDYSITMKDLNASTIVEINTLWELYKKYPTEWNHLASMLSRQVDKSQAEKNSEFDIIRKSQPIHNIIHDNQKLKEFSTAISVRLEIINTLISKSLIKFISDCGEQYCIEYKNRLTKECLTTQGKLLELKVFERCVSAKDKDGEYVYNSVKTGVKIDWTGLNSDLDSTMNEVDVIAMHGMVPVYISCKNGLFNADEMYKISSVAHAFGRKYARKIIVSTLTENEQNMAMLRERAKDMKIKLIENFATMDDKEIEKCVAAFWQK